MLSLIDGPLPSPCSAPFNMARYVLGHADRLADKSALQILRRTGAERWSYGRLERAILGVAAGLLQTGCRPGDRVLLRLGNGIAFPLAFLGSLAAGLVPVPTSATLTKPEVARLAAIVGPRLIVAGEGICLPDPAICPVLMEPDLRGFESLAPAPWAMGDPDRPAYIVFTSGTSGEPRAVVHAHRAIRARAMMVAGWNGIVESDRVFHSGALNWTYTLGAGLFDPWLAGATALVAADTVVFDDLPLLLRRFDATIFAAVPGVYRKFLAKSGDLRFPRLRHCLSAGEKLPARIRNAWRDATGTDLHEAMGLSECSTFLSSSPARPAPDGALGYVQDGRRIAVLGPDGAPVPRGVEGILAIDRHDPGLFLAYLNRETERHFSGDWFLTGDIVAMAQDGAVTSLGRADDMINAGGYRVSPSEIEAAFLDHPDVTTAAAIEVTVKADTRVIALFYSGAADEPELRAHVRERLAAYKQPRLYLRRSTLPCTANGKINRRILRDEWGIDI